LPFARTGKLIVATDDAQIAGLAALRDTAHRNGVLDVDWVEPPTLKVEEPALHCVAALRSPSTGIIDSHQLMLSLIGEAESEGAVTAYGTELTAAEVRPEGIALWFDGAEQPSLSARTVVNCAGLDATILAGRIRGLDDRFVPARWLAKGSYFALSGKTPFSTLVYPVPTPGGLGVHLTLDLGGRARFGPDVEWIDAIDYSVDAARSTAFHAAIRRYWPDLPDASLDPAYAGIRPRIAGPGDAPADFRIDGPQVHGVPGLINLFGIESPGLTASLAIARHVAGLLA